jgi:hypothetical protein
LKRDLRPKRHWTPEKREEKAMRHPSDCSAFDQVKAGFAQFDAPSPAALAQVMAEALEADAEAKAQADAEAHGANLSLIAVVEEFLALHRGSEAYEEAGLNGHSFEALLRCAGGDHG